ncbi:MAG: serine/threonine-protein kinase [Polyangiaceae bacterium]
MVGDATERQSTADSSGEAATVALSETAAADLASQPAPQVLPAGTLVREYRIDHLLGAGTFGEVYAGEQPVIGKPVAIKVLRPECSRHAEATQRFIAEARAIAQIRHPNIVDVFGFGALPDGRLYYVMDRLEGETLRARTLRAPLSIAETRNVLLPLARALAAAHAKDICHRDLKPENVFLLTDDEGRLVPRLLDFGIAKIPRGENDARTRTGAIMGTPSYMSPEQALGQPVDARADIYAFGLIAFELLTGRRLVRGDSMMAIVEQHVSAERPTCSSKGGPASPALDAAIARSIAREPSARWDTVLDCATAIDKALASLDPGFRPTLDGESSAVQAQSSTGGQSFRTDPDADSSARTMLAPAEGAVSPQKSAPKSTSKAWLFAAIGVAVAVAAAVAIATSRTSPAPSASAASTSSASAQASARADATPSTLPPIVVAPAPTSAAVATATASSSTVALSIVGAPSGALVELNGAPLGKSDDHLSLPRGAASVKLRVTKPGFQPTTVDVLPDRDREVSVSLRQTPAQSPTSNSEYGFE